MADPNVPQTPRRGLGRAGKVLLYVSLALNLAIAGIVIGAVVLGSDRAHDRGPPSGGEVGLRPVMQALSPEDRRSMVREVRKELRPLGRSRAEMRALMEDFVGAIAAVPYDHARVEALVKAQTDEAEIRLDVASGVFLKRLAGLTDEERLEFSERLAEEMSRPRGPRNGKRDN